MGRSRFTDQTNETLINLVHQQPDLYDSMRPGHRDVNEIFNAWQGISKIMDVEGMDGTSWKKQWRNLRDTYVKKRRMLKARQLGQAVPNSPRWRFMCSMSFLDDYIEEGGVHAAAAGILQDSESMFDNTLSSNEYDRDEDGDGESADTNRSTPTMNFSHLVKREPQSCDYENPQIGEDISKRHSPYPQPHAYKKRRGDDIVSLSADVMKAHSRNTQFQEKTEKTAEDLFFESCALRMKKLPAATKSLLQLQISQLFYNAEIQTLQHDYQPVTITQTERSQVNGEETTTVLPPDE
ncbi:hypothetical protein ScPMuIL_008629 [Solemya velum]